MWYAVSANLPLEGEASLGVVHPAAARRGYFVAGCRTAQLASRFTHHVLRKEDSHAL
jgi:hypothetical protein